MLTLALDTSTAHGSVAALRDGSLVFQDDFVADRSHSSTLFAVLERAHRECGRFDLLAVGLGPGSYAGVRIAIAAALGLGLATGARLVGLPSVAALPAGGGRYVAIGDARRGSFYWTLVEHGFCREGPELLEEAELRARLARAADPILSSESLPAEFRASLAFPSAAGLARLAAAGQGIAARDDLEPIYLREPHITQPKPRG